MNRASVLLLIAIAGTAFGMWPLITRGSKLHYIPAAFALQIGTMVMFLLFMAAFKNNLDLKNALTFKTAGAWAFIALAAGLVNGVGQLAFQNLIAEGREELSRFAPATLTIQAIVFTLGGWVIYGEPLTTKKLVGILASIIAVRFLMGK